MSIHHLSCGSGLFLGRVPLINYCLLVESDRPGMDAVALWMAELTVDGLYGIVHRRPIGLAAVTMRRFGSHSKRRAPKFGFR